MTRASKAKRQRGFSLIELLVALGIFLLITGAAFSLLTSSQQRFQTDTQLLNSFQEARLGVDQMVRDINDSGFPPPSFTTGQAASYAITPFAWSVAAGYSTTPPPTPCHLGTAGGGTCTTSVTGDSAPGDFDIIIETKPNPNAQEPSCSPTGPVQWIRYQLAGPNGTTLMRGVANKQPGHDPDADTSAQLVPFVQNVVNNTPTLQIGQFQLFAAYPNIFTGGASSSIPLFQYYCDTPTAPQSPAPFCRLAVTDNSPLNIRDIAITLIVASPLPDATTGQPRLIQLSARGRRINPNQ